MSRLLLLLHSNRRLLDACPRGNNETKRPRPYVHGDGGRSGERWRRAEPQAHVASLWTPSCDPLGLPRSLHLDGDSCCRCSHKHTSILVERL